MIRLIYKEYAGNRKTVVIATCDVCGHTVQREVDYFIAHPVAFVDSKIKPYLQSQGWETGLLLKCPDDIHN